MSRFFYDLHIHSCLSPCADDDMTPANIAGMAMLNGLQIVALTDHNTCKNCPAFFHHARSYGLVPVAGMELTTAEDIHVICLFPTLESAMCFDRLVDDHRIPVANRPEIFGNQLVMNEEDEVQSVLPDLLINATSLDLVHAYDEVAKSGGVCYPAHIDRQSGGMIAVLGGLPEEPRYPAFELNDEADLKDLSVSHPRLSEMRFVVSSDAHRLGDIQCAGPSLDLDDEPYSSAKVRCSLIDYLKGEA